MKRIWQIIRWLENPILSGILIFIILTLTFYLVNGIWNYLFTAFLTYFIADFIVKLTISGGNGIFNIKPIGPRTQHHGHALLFFSIVIIISTFVSAWGTDLITNQIKVYTEVLAICAIVAITVGIVYVNLHWTYLKR